MGGIIGKNIKQRYLSKCKYPELIPGEVYSVHYPIMIDSIKHCNCDSCRNYGAVVMIENDIAYYSIMTRIRIPLLSSLWHSTFYKRITNGKCIECRANILSSKRIEINNHIYYLAGVLIPFNKYQKYNDIEIWIHCVSLLRSPVDYAIDIEMLAAKYIFLLSCYVSEITPPQQIDSIRKQINTEQGKVKIARGEIGTMRGETKIKNTREEIKIAREEIGTAREEINAAQQIRTAQEEINAAQQINTEQEEIKVETAQGETKIKNARGEIEVMQEEIKTISKETKTAQEQMYIQLDQIFWIQLLTRFYNECRIDGKNQSKYNFTLFPKNNPGVEFLTLLEESLKKQRLHNYNLVCSVYPSLPIVLRNIILDYFDCSRHITNQCKFLNR